jgi:hypothetical protein
MTATQPVPERVFALMVELGETDPGRIADVLSVITGRLITPGARLEPDEVADATHLLERCSTKSNPSDALEQALAEIIAGRPE